MKNFTIKSLAVLMMLGAFAIMAFAQTPKRIDFAKEGSNSLVWEETVGAGKTKFFVFYAKKGQKLSLGMIDDTNKGSMDLGKESIEPNSDEPFEMTIEVSKDYTFAVSNNSNKSTSFRIFITLEDAKKTVVSTPTTPQAKRIDFAKEGSNALVWEEKVAAKATKSFVFYAKKGQKLSLNMIDDTNVGTMDLGKVSVEPNGDGLEMEIEVSKDYTFTVSNNSNKSTSFRISIVLEDAEDSMGSNDEPSGERVQFAKGETSAAVTKEIPANGSVDLIFNVKKGQTIGYTVGYDFKDSDIKAFLTEPGMQDISKTSGPKAPQEFVAKKSGDHRLTITNTTKKKVTITLYLDIN